MARSTWSALQLPMPVSRSGVMFAPLTLYSEVSQVCGPPACSRAMSSAPSCTRGVWQLPQVRIPSTRYFPRSSGVSAATAPAAMLNAATSHVPKRIIFPPCYSTLMLASFATCAMLASEMKAVSRSIAALGGIGLATVALAQNVDHAFQSILSAPAVITALADMRADDARTFEEQRTLTEIPSPPFKEQARAAYYVKRLREVGLCDATIDREGNVIGARKGRGGGPKLVISAHLDTVFPEGTDVKVKEKDGRYYAPGIGDDTRGLVELLAVIRAMNANALRTVGDVLFVGTVGEEELGDLRGVKALFRDHPDIDGFISLDGDRINRIVNRATGSHRYEAIFKR